MFAAHSTRCDAGKPDVPGYQIYRDSHEPCLIAQQHFGAGPRECLPVAAKRARMQGPNENCR